MASLYRVALAASSEQPLMFNTLRLTVIPELCNCRHRCGIRSEEGTWRFATPLGEAAGAGGLSTFRLLQLGRGPFVTP